MKLQSVKTLAASERNTAIDVFRGIAILAVVLFHFNNTLPYGYLGVDLFFVISGFLISGLLTKEVSNGERISFWNFVLQRGFKIWPSYLALLLLGNLFANVVYADIDPGQLMQSWELKKYLLFYKNFSMAPVHSVFDQAWSLCVEEHFYIALPIGLIIIQFLKKDITTVLYLTLLTIAGGIACKFISFYFSNSGDTAFATYNRMDGLAWGVLLNLLVNHFPEVMRRIKRKYLLFVAGLMLFVCLITAELLLKSSFFHKVLLLTGMPVCFFLMLAGLYSYNFKRLKALRFVAYYSYNWYLWHAMFIDLIIYYFGANFLTLCLFLIVSFAVAVFFTIAVEETFLRLRKLVMPAKQRSPVTTPLKPELVTPLVASHETVS